MCDSKASIIVSRLQGTSLRYCILHEWQGLPEYLPSDLDIVVTPKDLSLLEQTLLESNGARLVNLLQHEDTCFYFILAVREGKQARFLPVDAATDYRRDGRIWFSADELLQGRRKWRGFWVAAPGVEFKYLLVKKILKGAVPEHALRRLKELVAELGPETDAITEKLLGRKWARRVLEWIRTGDGRRLEAHTPILKRILKRRKLLKDPFNPLRYWLPEIRRIWRRWRYPTGLWIAVLGPDGSGKSTLISHLERNLAGAFRRTARFHLMPGLFRRRRGSEPVANPHGRPPRSRFTSLLKILYYCLDYTLGYWFKIRPALVHSTLVLFDRYYDDLLVDPQRYRYGGPIKPARWLRRLIPRPDLWLVLDVPEEEILRRKQEVPLEEIRRQREAYRRLATELEAIFLDGSQTPEEVAAQAREAVLEFLHERYLNQRHLWFPKPRNDLGWLVQALGGAVKQSGTPFLQLSLSDGRGYLLPQNSRRAAVQALSLYHPQKPKARVAKKMLSLGLRSGVRPFLPRVHLDFEILKELLEDVFGQKDLELGISLGTPGTLRKPVVQVMTPAGEVLGYVKVGWNKATWELVRNEARMLQYLQKKQLPFFVPRVLFAGEWHNCFLCVQSPPPGQTRPAPSDWDFLYEQAVTGMASFSLKWRRLEESAFWKRICERMTLMPDGYRRNTLERTMKQILEKWSSRELPFHQAHGDLTPWNACQINGNLYLYDWEYAQEEAPAGYDFFHFTVQRAWLVERLRPQQVVKTVLGPQMDKVKESYWKLVTAEHLEIRDLFWIYLLDRATLTSITHETTASQMALKWILFLEKQT